MRLETRLNGQLVQSASTDDMIFDVPTLISLMSEVLTLEPGDVILCGTSLGVLPMKPGSTVEVEIAGIGRLANTFG